MSTSGAGRYIGNPLFEAASVTTVPTSTQTTSKQPQASGVSNTDRGGTQRSSFFQDISTGRPEAAASRRQAFSFTYSDAESSRLRSNLFSLDSPLESSVSRYLEVPNSYSTDSASAATRYSLDSLGSRGQSEANKFLRHHSVDSPEHVRRSQFR